MRIGVLTSGGDSPGMNAAIRSVAVTGISRGHTVVGIRRGYEGLLAADAIPLGLAEVDGITRLGGTILGSARSALFPTPAGQEQARAAVRQLGLDALAVIGGNGSLTGAHQLAGHDAPCLVVGLPASIDNDIGHCGLSIGADTAVNTIVEACDRISDTARAHRRAFIVEVMGRHCGYLAMRAGIAAEADCILYGESRLGEDELVARLRTVLRRCFRDGQGTRALIIKSEGVQVPTARLVERLQAVLAEDAPGVEIRETILGHVVRGGNPSALDRMIGQRLGYAAVNACEDGLSDFLLSWEPSGGVGRTLPDPSVRLVPLAEVIAETARLLDGTSPVMRKRVELLGQVEDLLAL